MQFLLGQCYVVLEQHESVLLTLFVAGLVGGFTHCAGMCGPFVVAQVAGRHDVNAGLHRLAGAALVPYHLGRMTTYMFLGGVAALLSRQVMGSPLQQWVAVLFLSVAGVVFIVSALPVLKRKFARFRLNGLNQFGVLIGKMANMLFADSHGARGYGLGVFYLVVWCLPV